VNKEIDVIPNFIDTEKQKDSFGDCNRQLMAEDDERILTHISNFRHVKRIPDVINIFNKVQEKIKSKLIMVGEGPEVQPAKKLAEELGIADKILFLGKTSEVNKILCFSDLFLLPSENESFGLAALEAMVNGVPVISSDVGGIPEVVEQGFSGYLKPLGDVNAMAESALEILSSDEKLAQFKKQAKQTASKFDIREIVPQYEAVYEKAMKVHKD
jgi:N-acetyl-alpha-D-glucosaminyl L-malate synthase BshA